MEDPIITQLTDHFPALKMSSEYEGNNVRVTSGPLVVMNRVDPIRTSREYVCRGTVNLEHPHP